MKTLKDAIALYNDKAYEKAYDIFIDLAYKRNAEALFYLGLMNYFGEGVEKNMDKCMDYWKRATNEGHQESAYRLSEIQTTTTTTF